MAWCRDAKNDWHTELEQGIPPETLDNISLDISKYLGTKKAKSIKAYDPWNAIWTECGLKEGKIALPQFTRSIAVKVEYNKG